MDQVTTTAAAAAIAKYQGLADDAAARLMDFGPVCDPHAVGQLQRAVKRMQAMGRFCQAIAEATGELEDGHDLGERWGYLADEAHGRADALQNGDAWVGFIERRPADAFTALHGAASPFPRLA